MFDQLISGGLGFLLVISEGGRANIAGLREDEYTTIVEGIRIPVETDWRAGRVETFRIGLFRADGRGGCNHG